MRRRSKYIFGELKAAASNPMGAVVFPECCDHTIMARQNLNTVESAGFVNIVINAAGEVVVELYGESTGLNLLADSRHTKAVRRALGLDVP